MAKLKKMQYYFYGIGVAYFMLDQIFNQWLNYFYIPPENSNMKAVLSTSLLLIGFVIIRMVDAFSDIIVGYLSDNSKSKMGKRSYFMFLGGLPLGISTILFFFPPRVNNQLVTLTYFIIVGSVYFISYTFVGGPYNSMIADFSDTQEERINLSTVQSVFRLIFTAIPLVFSGQLIQKIGNGDTTFGIRAVVILFAIISTILVYLCIYLLKEPTIISEKSISNDNKIKFKEILKYILNKQIILYFLGFFLFFSGFNVIRNILTYYVSLVLHENLGVVTIISAIMFGMSAIFFPITSFLAKKFGNRKIMILNLITIIIPLLIISILSLFNANYKLLSYILFAIMGAGFSGAAFIFPPAMLSEICYDLKKDKDINIEGLMFGIQGFFLKLAFLVQATITTLGIVYKSQIIDGKQNATVEGVYLNVLIAMFLLILSTVIYYINNKR